jgi:hypothetical protein
MHTEDTVSPTAARRSRQMTERYLLVLHREHRLVEDWQLAALMIVVPRPTHTKRHRRRRRKAVEVPF